MQNSGTGDEHQAQFERDAASHGVAGDAETLRGCVQNDLRHRGEGVDVAEVGAFDFRCIFESRSLVRPDIGDREQAREEE